MRESPASCTTCSKAKSKCVRRPESLICERCLRLSKDCHTRETIQRKRKSVMITRNAQLKHLQEKLEDITKVLEAKETQDSCVSTSRNATTLLEADLPCHITKSNTKSLSKGFPINIAPFSSAAPRRSAVHGTQGSDKEQSSLNPDDEDGLFDRYQRLMALHFPFVVIPLDMNATTLAKSKPFLMQAMTVVASFHDTTKQQILAKDLMRQLCERVMINSEKSLDLLQGSLLFAAWFNPHLFQTSSHNNLLHLTMALTRELDIDRPPGFCEKAMMEAATKAYGIPQPTKTVSNDECRAVLGTFYVTSVIFSSFRKADVVGWTPWLSECTRILDEAKEYESDAHLVQLVQMQRIMQEAMLIDENEVPAQISQQLLQGRLESINPSPVHDSMANVICLQKACTQVTIWERLFVSSKNHQVIQEDFQHRLDGMWRCVEATKDYIDAYMEMPIENYPLVPFSIFAQFAYVFVVIVRASFMKSNGWDVEAVREHIDFSSLTEEVSRRCDAVSQTRPDGILLHNEGFTNWSGKMKWVKAFYDTQALSETSQPRVTSQVPISPIATTFASSMGMANLDDCFWNLDSSIFSSGDSGLELGGL